MKAKIYPEQDMLNEMFNYNSDSGILTWKERPLSHFSRRCVMASWNGKNAGRIAGTLLDNKNTGKKYLQTGMSGKLYLNHRIIYIMVNGNIKTTEQIDHINCNGLDNRIDNLRLLSGSLENNKNRIKQKNNTSGYTGISWHNANSKWQVRINADGKRKSIGYFDNIDSAIKARSEAELKYKYSKNHGKTRRVDNKQ